MPSLLPELHIRHGLVLPKILLATRISHSPHPGYSAKLSPPPEFHICPGLRSPNLCPAALHKILLTTRISHPLRLRAPSRHSGNTPPPPEFQIYPGLRSLDLSPVALHSIHLAIRISHAPQNSGCLDCSGKLSPATRISHWPTDFVLLCPPDLSLAALSSIVTAPHPNFTSAALHATQKGFLANKLPARRLLGILKNHGSYAICGVGRTRVQHRRRLLRLPPAIPLIMDLLSRDYVRFAPHRVFGRMLFDTGVTRMIATAAARQHYRRVHRLTDWAVLG